MRWSNCPLSKDERVAKVASTIFWTRTYPCSSYFRVALEDHVLKVILSTIVGCGDAAKPRSNDSYSVHRHRLNEISKI